MTKTVDGVFCVAMHAVIITDYKKVIGIQTLAVVM